MDNKIRYDDEKGWNISNYFHLFMQICIFGGLW